jgi:hypothetical protein
MIDIFNGVELVKDDITCHSGGARGSDTYFEKIGEEWGVRTKAWSYKTPSHKSPNKVEISEGDFIEGVNKIREANKILKRNGIGRYINLLARNWAQVKYSDEVFAIGTILNPGERGSRGFHNKSEFQLVDGGTGWACAMAIDKGMDLHVFNQRTNSWWRWSYIKGEFIKSDRPKITKQNFAGIGTREITQEGIEAIRELYQSTFS